MQNYDDRLGVDRHDRGQGVASLVMLLVVSTLLVATMVGLALFAKPSDAASQIDATYPVASSTAISTPIRGNFSIAKSEISALQAKFPGSTGTGNVASYADGTGSLTDAGICSLTGTTADTKQLLCGGRVAVLFTGSTGSQFQMIGASTGAALQVAQTGTGNVLRLLDGTTDLFVVDKDGAVATESDSSGVALTIEKSVNDGDLVSFFTANGYGFDVRASAGAGDASFPVMQFEGETSSVGEAIVQYYQDGEGPLQVRSTVTTGLDPYELFRQQRRETTDATPTNFLYGVVIPSGQAYSIRSTVQAFVTAGANDNKVADYEIACIASNIGGTTTLIGSTTTAISTIEETGLSSLAVACTVNDSTDTVHVTVTGLASNTITWIENRRAYRLGE